MKGLVYNNLISVLKSKNVQVIGILFVFYLILDYMWAGINMGFIFIYIMGALSVSFFGMSGDNESLVWNSYEVSLPVSRKKIILSKFISSLILLLIGFVIAELYYILVYIMHYKEFVPFEYQVGNNTIVNVYMLCLSLLWMDLVSPLIMKFGVITGKIFAIACLCAMLYASYMVRSEALFSMDMPEVQAGFIGLAVIGVVLSIVSYFVCCKIYENKEF